MNPIMLFVKDSMEFHYSLLDRFSVQTTVVKDFIEMFYA